MLVFTNKQKPAKPYNITNAKGSQRQLAVHLDLAFALAQLSLPSILFCSVPLSMSLHCTPYPNPGLSQNKAKSISNDFTLTLFYVRFVNLLEPSSFFELFPVVKLSS